MSNLINGITFSLFINENFEDRFVAKKITDVFLRSAKTITPKKFGYFQPDVKIVDAEKVIDVLVNKDGPKVGPRAGSLILEASKGCGFQIQWNKSSQPCFSFIGGHLMFENIHKDNEILNDYIRLVRDLVAEFSFEYGEVRSMALKGWDLPLNLQIRLPDIPPISIYGKNYISFFGEEKIKRAPFLKLEKIGDSYWLVAEESLFNEVPEVKRAKIRSYLGEDSFMANGKWKYSDGNAPKFDLSFSSCN